MKKLSRRDFLKGAAASAASVSVLSLMGCASGDAGTTEAEKQTEKQTENLSETKANVGETVAWDYEADAVVVGTGTAIIAAIAASEMNVGSIVVLEKSEFMFGGTSSLSGGGSALPGFLTDFADENNGDTREKCISYMMACGEDRMSEEVITSFVDHSQEYVDWIKATMNWSKFKHIGIYNDYYFRYQDSIPGAIGRGCAQPFDMEGNQVSSAAQWQQYHDYVDSHDNITLLMGTAGDSLITDENGKVIGIVAKQGDKEIRIKANKGVVLGTGGFDYNEEMRKSYLPLPLYHSCCVTSNTGDAHRMGARLGAKLTMMDRYMGVPFPYANPVWNENDDRNYSILASSPMADWGMFTKFPHSICVNRKGKRFGDEGSQYDVFCRAFNAYDNGLMKYENIPAFFIADAEYASRFTLPYYVAADGELPEYVFKFDSLEELADGMGIDKEGLLEQVSRFNQMVENKVDTEWHRGESIDHYNTMMFNVPWCAVPGYDAAAELTDLTSTLGTISKAPFYCVRYVPGTCGTRGGLAINGNAQVLNVDGEVIEGLYAAGAASAGVAGYWAGGACISQGCVMSYIAAKHMAGKA